MEEIHILKMLIFLALIIAPIITNVLLLKKNKYYLITQGICLSLIFFGELVQFPPLAGTWFIICAMDSYLYIKKQPLHLNNILTLIPFGFSFVALTWLIAGSNDLYLLGFNQNWSFYAALHGNFLGWTFCSYIAFLINKFPEKSKGLNILISSILILFLCIAIGINGVPVLKKFGVIGLTICLTIFYVHILSLLQNVYAKRYIYLSIITILITMGMAITKEFYSDLGFIGDIPVMVLIHGVLNALIVIPSIFIALKKEFKI